MVPGPEMASIAEEFQTILPQDRSSTKHHKQKPAVQTSFAKEVKSPIGVTERRDNPFTENSLYIALDSLDISDSEVESIVKTVLDVSTTKCTAFLSERFIRRIKQYQFPSTRTTCHSFLHQKGVLSQRISNKLHL